MTDFERKYEERAAFIEECRRLVKGEDKFNSSVSNTTTENSNTNDLLFQQAVETNALFQQQQQAAADLGAFMHQQMFMGI